MEGAKPPKRKSPAKRRFCAKTPRAQDVAFLVFRGTTPLQMVPILPGEMGAQKRRFAGDFRLGGFAHSISGLQQRHSEQCGHLDRRSLSSDRDAQKPTKCRLLANAKPVRDPIGVALATNRLTHGFRRYTGKYSRCLSLPPSGSALVR